MELTRRETQTGPGDVVELESGARYFIDRNGSWRRLPKDYPVDTSKIRVVKRILRREER